MFPYLNKNNLENDFLENNNKNTTVIFFNLYFKIININKLGNIK